MVLYSLNIADVSMVDLSMYRSLLIAYTYAHKLFLLACCIFQYDNVTFYIAGIIRGWLEEHKEILRFPWPPKFSGATVRAL